MCPCQEAKGVGYQEADSHASHYQSTKNSLDEVRKWGGGKTRNNGKGQSLGLSQQWCYWKVQEYKEYQRIRKTCCHFVPIITQQLLLVCTLNQ